MDILRDLRYSIRTFARRPFFTAAILVVSYSVTQRTAELGLRIALGASRAGLLWLVIRGTLTLIVIAAALGWGRRS